MSDASGTVVELEVSTVAHGGVFVARHEGRVVFVSDTLPGERVRAAVHDDSHARYWRAETVEVLEASDHRRRHIWPEAALERDPAERAGGAEFGHIELAFQRELKRQVLTEAMSRMAGLDVETVVEPIGDDAERDGLGWRTRVRLHVDESGRCGPYAARTHTVVPVRSLPLAMPEVAAAAPMTQTFPGTRTVDVVGPSASDPVVLVRPGDRGRHPIRERVGRLEFGLDARGFWQVHADAPHTLVAAVVDLVDETVFDPDAANLDLYSGVGLFSAALADRFGSQTSVTAVESDARANPFAARNLGPWPRVRTSTARVDRFLERMLRSASRAQRRRQSAATVILDPPRSGAGAKVVEPLAQIRPAQVVYVACDPVALARDVALFTRAGYELDALRAFDLFPHTHHFEAVARLRRVP